MPSSRLLGAFCLLRGPQASQPLTSFCASYGKSRRLPCRLCCLGLPAALACTTRASLQPGSSACCPACCNPSSRTAWLWRLPLPCRDFNGFVLRNLGRGYTRQQLGISLLQEQGIRASAGLKKLRERMRSGARLLAPLAPSGGGVHKRRASASSEAGSAAANLEQEEAAQRSGGAGTSAGRTKRPGGNSATNKGGSSSRGSSSSARTRLLLPVAAVVRSIEEAYLRLERALHIDELLMPP